MEDKFHRIGDTVFNTVFCKTGVVQGGYQFGIHKTDIVKTKTGIEYWFSKHLIVVNSKEEELALKIKYAK